MLAAGKGYYDGERVVIAEDDRKSLSRGDELIITIVDGKKLQNIDKRLEKRKKVIESGMYITQTGRTTEEIDNDIKELRNDDRF